MSSTLRQCCSCCFSRRLTCFQKVFCSHCCNICRKKIESNCLKISFLWILCLISLDISHSQEPSEKSITNLCQTYRERPEFWVGFLQPHCPETRWEAPSQELSHWLWAWGSVWGYMAAEKVLHSVGWPDVLRVLAHPLWLFVYRPVRNV